MLDYAEKGKDLTSIFFVVHKMNLPFWRVYPFLGEKKHNYYMVQSIPPFEKLKETPKSQDIVSR